MATIQPLPVGGWSDQERLRIIEQSIQEHVDYNPEHTIIEGHHQTVDVSSNEQRYTIWVDSNKAVKKYEEITVFDPADLTKVKYKTRTYFDVLGVAKRRIIFTDYDYTTGLPEFSVKVVDNIRA